MYDKYMTIELDKDSIYLVEEMYGIEIERVRLNKVTNATIVNFYDFFNSRFRRMPIIIKNEKPYLAVVKQLIPQDKPLKGKLLKLTDTHILLDISSKIDNESFVVGTDKKILKDVRPLFENV